MAKSSPTEKRLEERLTQELRDFQRSNPANKRCFDCNEMTSLWHGQMPQYVCLDFNTFVCTACSGIHREFAHRVKSISMSKFTESEVKNMVGHGGNEAAQKYWRAKHDPSFRPNGGTDGERTRNFIRLTYIDRKWVYGSPRHAKDEESKSSKKKEKKTTGSDDNFFTSSKKSAKATSSSADSGFADFSNFEGSSRTAAAVQSFGDFSNFDAPAASKKAGDGFADFGDFEGSSSTAIPEASRPSPAASSPFDAFDAPTPTSRAGSRANSAASLDPFSDMSAAAPAAPPAAPVILNASPFDAFGSPSASSSPAFDAFAAPASTAGSNVFDAFGGGGDAFGDFTGSNSSSRTNSANAGLDPFASKPEKPAAPAAAADPFAAFDGMQSNAPTPGNTAPTPDFGAPGFAGNSNSSNQATTSDPFGFASGASSGNGFPGAHPQQQQQPVGAPNQAFGGFPGGFPQQQQPQNAIGGHMQQQQRMQQFQQGQPPHAQQQQWYGQQQGFPGQQQPMHPPGQQYPGQFPPRPAGGAAPPAPIPVKTPASAASINDPFASLNLGNLGFGGSSYSNTTAARTGSGGVVGSAPANRSGASNSFGSVPTAPVPAGSFAYGQPQPRASNSFSHPPQNAAPFADPNAFGDFASAPAPSQPSASSANPFDLF
ncbi:hypothetical protein PHYSODRAFT_258326 [Phytophthora sojae]|uniref:Arf-GAP domain-containing protein n=1 Tax=Phytophthora sojae (strain P6497) TaxID=1094619 RepID=G4YF74_PHYSP|nr:hypothetical protein PHYSODRAFT_258326 [Phytophthora sojae]EGZ27978.1 hypothetical protein PHYSODRAFT_258326 [Phytophthora sojae]|eukprot:XP_009515253.1 hypothetical protein PHYSODRAFT_258326 [Phytophthora sojae]